MGYPYVISNQKLLIVQTDAQWDVQTPT